MRFPNFCFWIGLIISILSLHGLYAQDRVFTISSSLDYASIGKYIEILEDESGNLTIDDVTSLELSEQFFPSQANVPSFGFTSSVYWVRLTVLNPQDKSVDWYLEIGYPLIDYIDLFIPTANGDFKLIQTGDRLLFDSRELDYRNFIFSLSEKSESSQTYYLRFKTSSSMNFPLDFWAKDALLENIASEQIILGVYYGAFLIMIIYSIFLYIGFKDKSYISYTIFLIAFGLLQLALNGLAYQYLWPNWIWWANVNVPFIIFVTTISMMIFSRSVLDSKKYAPLGDKILKIGIIIFSLLVFLSLITPYAIMIRLGTAAALGTNLLVITIGLKIVLKNVHRAAYYFMIAFVLLFLGIVLFSLKTFGILPSNFITNWSLQIGSFAFVVLLSVAVQDRINQEKKEKYIAQKDALENQQKLVESLKESERILEEKVSDRTKELFDKNISLRSRTEELQKSYKNVTMLGEVGQRMTSTFELKEIMKTIYNGLVEFMDVSIFALGLYDENRQKINFVYCIEDSKRMPSFSVSTNSEYELSVWCIKNRKHIFINDFDAEKSKFFPKGAKINTDTYGQSVIYIPLAVENRIIGVATVQSFKKNAYTNYHLDIMKTLVSYGAIALDNAYAYQQIKIANEELKKAQTQLIYSEKMASLGQLTAGIAHEIKNPLNFVNNFAEGSVELTSELLEEIEQYKNIIEKDSYQNISELLSDIRQNVIDILENGKRADRIVHSMMDHARGTKTEREGVNINELVDENINLAYHGYRAREASFNVDIQKEFDDSQPMVEVIPQDMGRVLLNILNNACYAVHRKAQEEGEGYSPILNISTKSVNNEVEIHIRDNGSGIPVDIRKKIFEPFFTTKPTGEGNTGLGLSISYDIVVQGHMGKIQVESEPGEFTEFVIILPKVV